MPITGLWQRESVGTLLSVPAVKRNPSDRKDEFLKVRVTADRLRRWKEAAEAARHEEDDVDLDFSAWVRRALNRAVDDMESRRGPTGRATHRSRQKS
jgi:hypothetical protein